MRISVPDVVKELIAANRSIYDCVKMDIVNYTALAARLQPQIERQIGNTVNLNTIVVAIKRYADSFDRTDAGQESVLKDARLSMTDGIMGAQFSTRDVDAAELLDRFSKISPDYELFRMADSVRVVAEDMDAVRRLFEILPGGDRLSTGLAKIKILIPESGSNVVSYVAELLARRGIPIANAYFGRDNIVIIVDEEDASRAYEVLRGEITRS